MRRPNYALMFGVIMPFMVAIYGLAVAWIYQGYEIEVGTRMGIVATGLCVTTILALLLAGLIYDNWGKGSNT